MTSKGLGMTAIVDDSRRVIGVFTDGDLRRALDRAADLRTTHMGQVMSQGSEVRAALDARGGSGALDGNPPHYFADRARRSGRNWSGALNVHDLLRAGVF